LSGGARAAFQEDVMTIHTLHPAPAPPSPHIIESPSHQEIAERAFNLFEARGGDGGRDLDDWLQAERELLHVRSRQVDAINFIEEDPYRSLAEPAWP
jgi:Protein of unknown function (DUF2934)